jgi:phosphoribosylanthranilate isomerase
MSVIVKICGITNVPDALAAAEAGADAIGFIFHPKSPRYIAPEQAAEIARVLPPHIVKVGVFVDASDQDILRAIANCGLELLQFHGDESPEFCKRFGVMSMKAFRVRDASSLARLTDYNTDAWLLDAYSTDQLGGTGERFNWDLAVEAGKSGKLIFLAGGLKPENVGEAVTKVRPYAVDVSSGVEKSPGKKDHDRVSAFIKAAKAAAVDS